MPIEFKKVNFQYTSQVDTIIPVLKDINLSVSKGEFVSVIGHTGSGKSTLVQNINALIQPFSGVVVVDGYEVKPGKLKQVDKLRKKIGMAFQFAENQLFEETILKDVMFGPLNFGYSNEEAMENAKSALIKVGIEEELFQRSPYELSGGQMRRVALAGILSYNPEIIILDEPTVGLDPIGQIQMMELFKELNDEGKTIIMISHNLNDVVEYCDRVIMLNEGKVIFDGDVDKFFMLEEINGVDIELPHTISLGNKIGIKNVGALKYNDLLDWIVDNYE
ncbi:MAG: ATP-binding cassette domain-containing protein [Bacilli bacterium]